MAMWDIRLVRQLDNVRTAAPSTSSGQAFGCPAGCCPAWFSLVYLRGVCGYDGCVRYKIRFLWNATKGHRLAPWRSPYLLWRIETYTGVKMTQIGFVEFWEFMWRERRDLWRFLKWTAEMERYVHPKPKNS